MVGASAGVDVGRYRHFVLGYRARYGNGLVMILQWDAGTVVTLFAVAVYLLGSVVTMVTLAMEPKMDQPRRWWQWVVVAVFWPIFLE